MRLQKRRVACGPVPKFSPPVARAFRIAGIDVIFRNPADCFSPWVSRGPRAPPRMPKTSRQVPLHYELAADKGFPRPTMQRTSAPVHQRGRLRLASVLSYEPSLLNGLDWRQFGYVTLLAAAFGSEQMLSGLANDNFMDMFITWVPGTLFIGIGALVVFTVLSNWKRPLLPRWVALAVSVLVVSVVVRYLEAMALSSGDANSCDWAVFCSRSVGRGCIGAWRPRPGISSNAQRDA